MIVRLHNLSSRSPLQSDLDAIVELRAACDTVDFGCVQTTRQDVEKAWQADGFNRLTDAWVVVTRRGQLVGYADVWREQTTDAHVHLNSSLYVHPEFRGRGIGTLLTMLTEERARELARTCQSHAERVVLYREVGTMTQSANHLLQREGYTLVHRYWRVSLDDGQECRSIDVPTTAHALHALKVQKRTGLYMVQHYNVYEKVLRGDDDGGGHKDVHEPYTEPLMIDDVNVMCVPLS